MRGDVKDMLLGGRLRPQEREWEKSIEKMIQIFRIMIALGVL